MTGSEIPNAQNTPERSPPISGGHHVHCPNCSRYIGPVTKCPFCNFEIPKKRAYNTLKWGAMIWAVVGLLLIQQMYALTPNPTVKIGDLDRENNYSYVTIEGVIVNTPSYWPDEDGVGGSVYIWVDDGTGQISVKAYESAVEEMIEMNKIPAYGDRVKLQGNFQYRGYEFSMILNTAKQLEITRSDPIDLAIAAIENAGGSEDLNSMRARVNGTVSYWKTFDWAIDIYLTDGNGSLVDIWIPKSVTDLTGEGDVYSIYEGAQVEVVGALKWYEAGSYSRWEIIPATSDDFRIVSPGGVS